MPRLSKDESALAAVDDTTGAASGPRWSRIAAHIAAQIEAGQHPDGSTLPAAAVLAESYGVNRHTVRQALKHLQDVGLVSVARGRGTHVATRRMPYRLGKRVSFRANFGAAGLHVTGEILESSRATAESEVATMLGIEPGSPVWEIRTLNRAAGLPVSTGLHFSSVDRFPDFDRRLAAAQASISGAFASYGITDYVRLTTRLTARTASKPEASILGLDRGAPVMQSFGIDGLEDGTPLQIVAAVFDGARVEMVLERDS
jgi:GntR family phosphonate transport system transcriptional regulator